jgi:hypothetical protein
MAACAEDGGLEALIDQHTGFQEVKARDELLKILEPEIEPELMPWVRNFPDEFFRAIYAIEREPYSKGVKISYLSTLINEFIFKPLPKNIGKALRRHAPASVESGNRSRANSKYPSYETGDRYLDCQIARVTTAARLACNKWELETNLQAIFPELQTLFPPESSSTSHRPLRHIEI